MKTVLRYSAVTCFAVSVLLLLVSLRYYSPTKKTPLVCDRDDDDYGTVPHIRPLYPNLPRLAKPKYANLAPCSTGTCMHRDSCKKFTISIRNTSRAAKFHSGQFKILLQVIQNLPFYREFSLNGSSCFTIFNVDVLDRDSLNPATYVNVPDYGEVTHIVNSDRATNYVFFNSFSGTFPDYSEQLDFNVSRALLIKSSVTHELVRCD